MQSSGVLEIMEEVKKEWHLDRKVTVGIILALLLNAGSSIWWASRLDYTVQTHETRLNSQDKTIEHMKDQGNFITDRLARIEEGLKFQIEIMKDIKVQVHKR